MFRDLQWLDIVHPVRYHRLCMVNSVHTSGKPEDIANTIGDIAQHRYVTRSAGRHVLPKIRPEAGRRRPCYGAVREYDQLTICRVMRA